MTHLEMPPLREPLRAPSHLANRIVPGASAHSDVAGGGCGDDGAFLELFVGLGGLTKELRKLGVPCSRPIEAYGPVGYVKEDDLSRAEVVEDLVNKRRSGVYYYIHMGTPCSSFSSLQALNGGTRTKATPSGDGSKPNEVLGNLLVANSCRIAWAQIEAGLFSQSKFRSGQIFGLLLSWLI